MCESQATEESHMPQKDASWEIPEVPADSLFVQGVASKDERVVHNADSVWVRIYLPELAVGSPLKLPVIVHVHGGGFMRFSAATLSNHEFCKKLATEVPSLVVSLTHRLAPTYRLPAAYDDLTAALEWLKLQAVLQSGKLPDVSFQREEWLCAHGDFSRLIFLGGSSGGNIVHNTLSRADTDVFSPLRFVGQVLLEPFFGGVQRTDSELRLSKGPILTLDMSDLLWSMALPEGSTRDHPFCNPTLGFIEPRKFPRTLVIIGGKDLLHDRQVEFASLMVKAGVDVKLVDFEDATHGFVTPEGTVSYIFMPELLAFIRSC